MDDNFTDKQLVIMALQMYRNHLQTGDVFMSSQEAENVNAPVKALNPMAMRRVLRMEEMIDGLMNGEVQIIDTRNPGGPTVAILDIVGMTSKRSKEEEGD